MKGEAEHRQCRSSLGYHKRSSPTEYGVREWQMLGRRGRAGEGVWACSCRECLNRVLLAPRPGMSQSPCPALRSAPAYPQSLNSRSWLGTLGACDSERLCTHQLHTSINRSTSSLHSSSIIITSSTTIISILAHHTTLDRSPHTPRVARQARSHLLRIPLVFNALEPYSASGDNAMRAQRCRI